MEAQTHNENEMETDTQFEMIKYKNQYAIEAWYESIKDYTYKTEFLELHKEECQVIVNWYSLQISCARSNKPMTMAEDHVKIIEKLKTRISDKIKTLEASNGFFFKLSTRSPKDSVMASPKLRDILADQLKVVKPRDENAEIVLYLDCMIRAFQVHDAEEVVDLLLKSERFYTDLDRWLGYTEKLAPINLIFREYDDNIRPHMEFRGFVFKKKLTAVSQYYDSVYYDFLVKNKDKVQLRIQEFFESTICPLISLENYIIDFVVYDETDDNKPKIIVIELNPWAKTTGASMFSWYEQSDVKILRGESPFELRVRTEPIENIKRELFPDIQNVINAAQEKSGTTMRGKEDKPKKEKKDCTVM